MYKDIEEVFVEFDDHSGRVSADLYNKFSTAVASLPRKNNENVFQQISGQYIFTLKEQLSEIALSLLEKYKYKDNDHKHLQEKFTGKIEAYITEFSRKCRYD